jgi:hypothetical protein
LDERRVLKGELRGLSKKYGEQTVIAIARGSGETSTTPIAEKD